MGESYMPMMQGHCVPRMCVCVWRGVGSVPEIWGCRDDVSLGCREDVFLGSQDVGMPCLECWDAGMLCTQSAGMHGPCVPGMQG